MKVTKHKRLEKTGKKNPVYDIEKCKVSMPECRPGTDSSPYDGEIIHKVQMTIASLPALSLPNI